MGAPPRAFIVSFVDAVCYRRNDLTDSGLVLTGSPHTMNISVQGRSEGAWLKADTRFVG
jgi:hypothetical protein